MSSSDAYTQPILSILHTNARLQDILDSFLKLTCVVAKSDDDKFNS
ncbi:hypothetical protein L914_01614 [Phytophthora nicotianae]|uniref:Uncharacterized protein n=1 Tax=Phytophthora nicotianae TaxID=4792 RepID=W2P291_PHYNI|nr:hypothetical protein L916_01598 [Phytophthora nicotianae]ETM55127.1 hypothetical protein L914_01614 [Phytophthora nicotianae]